MCEVPKRQIYPGIDTITLRQKWLKSLCDQSFAVTTSSCAHSCMLARGHTGLRTVGRMPGPGRVGSGRVGSGRAVCLSVCLAVWLSGWLVGGTWQPWVQLLAAGQAKIGGFQSFLFTSTGLGGHPSSPVGCLKLPGVRAHGGQNLRFNPSALLIHCIPQRCGFLQWRFEKPALLGDCCQLAGGPFSSGSENSRHPNIACCSAGGLRIVS